MPCLGVAVHVSCAYLGTICEHVLVTSPALWVLSSVSLEVLTLMAPGPQHWVGGGSWDQNTFALCLRGEPDVLGQWPPGVTVAA